MDTGKRQMLHWVYVSSGMCPNLAVILTAADLPVIQINIALQNI
jgi:hypothetical protein